MTNEPVEQAAELLTERAMRHHFGGRKNLARMETGKLIKGVQAWRKLYLARARKDARALAKAGLLRADEQPENRWKPGDPCGKCGSRNTRWGDTGEGAVCNDCGACDSDE